MQVDIKKVLAYSTVSQLGYMVMGLGVGAWTPAVFHIFTHAFFKACLFLGAGSVSHSASHHSFDMKKDMGGLWKKMPITFATFMVAHARPRRRASRSPASARRTRSSTTPAHNGYAAFMVIGLVGAFLTAAYMTRCVYLTFFGEPRGGRLGRRGARASHDDRRRTVAARSPTTRTRSRRTSAEHARRTADAHGARTAATTTTPGRTSRPG